jgi:hypothetical protein
MIPTTRLRVTTPRQPEEEAADRRARVAARVAAILAEAISGTGSEMDAHDIARAALEVTDALLEELGG